MSKLLDDATINITCPNCGKETEKKIGWVNKNSTFACPHCGKPVTLKADQFREEIRRVEMALRKFGENLGKL